MPKRAGELKFLANVNFSGNDMDKCPANIWIINQKNELLLSKSKRKGLIFRALLLQRILDEHNEEDDAKRKEMKEGGRVQRTR
jgi:hypothetical protein